MSTTKIFKSNKSQAVRLAKDVAFPESVTEVQVRKEGRSRIITPSDVLWDDFFNTKPSTDFPEREQPKMQDREAF